MTTRKHPTPAADYAAHLGRVSRALLAQLGTHRQFGTYPRLHYPWPPSYSARAGRLARRAFK